MSICVYRIYCQRKEPLSLEQHCRRDKGTVISDDNYVKIQTGLSDSLKIAKKNKISVNMVQRE
jgi:hypothetical protein